MSKRKFNRPLGEKRYRKMFIIAVEGRVTECQYFSLFNQENSTIKVKCLSKKDKSSPKGVLKCMTNYLKENSLAKSDEAWLVIDKDQWVDEQIMELYRWSLTGSNLGFALTNPKFEYWLLLHFEKGAGITSSNDCSLRLKNYLPDYNKALDIQKITKLHIEQAIINAKKRDNPPCQDWPRELGISTVYKLVDKILQR